MIKVHYMHVWKYHTEIPLYKKSMLKKKSHIQILLHFEILRIELQLSNFEGIQFSLCIWTHADFSQKHQVFYMSLLYGDQL
jgi:hypothetical protein